MNRSSLKSANYNDHYEEAVERKAKADKSYDILEPNYIPVKSTVVVQ